MRDYLYLWNDKTRKCLVASGIEFEDIVRTLPTGTGAFLLRHGYPDAKTDRDSRLEYVEYDDFPDLCKSDIYSFGDFVFAPFRGPVPKLTKESLSQLLYFGHTSEPYERASIPGLNNAWLYWGHDNGWFAKICYDQWSDLENMLTPILSGQPEGIVKRINSGLEGLWITGSVIHSEKTTYDIDEIMGRRLTDKSGWESGSKSEG